MLRQFAAIACLLIGELFTISAEMIGARHYGTYQTITPVLLPILLLMIAGGICLIAGYVIGYHAFRNIWIVSAASITAILIVEPILGLALFQQLPTKGALIGFVAGIIGFIAALTL